MLALTFTNKAAKQMQEKLAKMIGQEKTKALLFALF
ncbi:UvrD-helicase domain-containing protein [Areca yellow leaf disease phytoplasma]